MKNKFWIIFVIMLLLIGIGLFLFIRKNSSDKSSNYESSRVSTNNSTNNSNINSSNDTNVNNNSNSTNSSINNSNNTINMPASNSEVVEEQITTFSTKIYTKETERQNNINITCSTLNDTIVPYGSTFSFCSTVGQATSSKGYQEADIFDKDGNKKKGLGGGNCQVSTTLYNAVLQVSNLVVVERHAHSNKVPYIAPGKDAAVAYGSYDFKFRNDMGNDIKIKASTDGNYVTITLIKLS